MAQTQYFYCSQVSCVKIMFLHLSDILSTEGVSATLPGRHNPPGHTSPLGIHPFWADTPWVDTHTPGQTPPVQCMLGYGQQTGGTHPTGMHSCLSKFLRIFSNLLNPSRIQSMFKHSCARYLIFNFHFKGADSQVLRRS